MGTQFRVVDNSAFQHIKNLTIQLGLLREHDSFEKISRDIFFCVDFNVALEVYALMFGIWQEITRSSGPKKLCAREAGERAAILPRQRSSDVQRFTKSKTMSIRQTRNSFVFQSTSLFSCALEKSTLLSFESFLCSFFYLLKILI